jgi:probable O-glycosylation ligase (exosortase A-associated)
MALLASMALITVAVIGSYSRGAFLAVIAVALFLWWKSKNRLVIGLGVLPMLPLLFLAMPSDWHERMGTITEYQQDASAMGRINAWTYSFNVANARLTGGGLDSWSAETFALWAPDPDAVHAAHSIYFSVLADHGWIGLLFFVGIYLAAWRQASLLIKACSEQPEWRWMADLSRMFQVSLVAYAVGGAFLSLSYYDLPWHIVCILVLMRTLLEEQGATVKQGKPVLARTGRAAVDASGTIR